MNYEIIKRAKRRERHKHVMYKQNPPPNYPPLCASLNFLSQIHYLINFITNFVAVVCMCVFLNVNCGNFKGKGIFVPPLFSHYHDHYC